MKGCQYIHLKAALTTRQVFLHHHRVVARVELIDMDWTSDEKHDARERRMATKVQHSKRVCLGNSGTG